MFSFNGIGSFQLVFYHEMKDKIAACAHVIGDKKGKLVSLQNTNLIDIYFQILNLENI